MVSRTLLLIVRDLVFPVQHRSSKEFSMHILDLHVPTGLEGYRYESYMSICHMSLVTLTLSRTFDVTLYQLLDGSFNKSRHG